MDGLETIPNVGKGPRNDHRHGVVEEGFRHLLGHVHFFDFFVYAIASVLVFPKLVFPHLDPLEGTLWSFAIFSLAFIARPIGTITSMYVQRRFSISTKLTLALFTLGTATVGIAFLPTYETAGTAAIVLLALYRLIVARRV